MVALPAKKEKFHAEGSFSPDRKDSRPPIPDVT